MTTIFWSDPLALQPDSQSTALIILNEPISSLPLLEQLWERGKPDEIPVCSAFGLTRSRAASLRICADGGANRLFEACEKLQNNQLSETELDRHPGMTLTQDS